VRADRTTLAQHKLLENLALGRLRVAKVHHLIQEFVDDHKIVADTLFFKFFEILDEDGREAMEKEDSLCGIGVVL
jgi:hypothetical protein